MKRKAAVLGIGRMGSVISWAMNKLGFFVVGLDSNENSLQNFRDNINEGDGSFYLTDQNNANKSMERALLFEKPDVVISSLPYHQTGEIALWCISNGLRYCDLGGRVDVSKDINKWAEKEAKVPVFTDLGLAPGWVNILAEHGYKKFPGPVEEVTMMVGGLPGIPNNPPLNYAVTWSTDGLINEYADDCQILRNGKIETVKGMDGLETVFFEMLQEDMEAFYTSGGASHTIENMEKRGVKNCNYKTLRWEGHCEAVRFLIRKCNLSNDCLLEIFKNGCCHSGGDIVLMRALVKSGGLQWKEEKIIASDSDGKFSAMQKATAFPIASVAGLMAEGFFEGNKEQHRDYWTQYPKALSYEDVPFKKFNSNLKKLGLKTYGKSN